MYYYNLPFKMWTPRHQNFKELVQEFTRKSEFKPGTQGKDARTTTLGKVSCDSHSTEEKNKPKEAQQLYQGHLAS